MSWVCVGEGVGGVTAGLRRDDIAAVSQSPQQGIIISSWKAIKPAAICCVYGVPTCAAHAVLRCFP